MLYELSTGDVPFVEEELQHLLYRQINEAPPLPTTRFPGVDPQLERIILHAIEKDKDARYATMRDFRTALRDLLDKPVASLSGRFPRLEPRVASRGDPPSSRSSSSAAGRYVAQPGSPTPPPVSGADSSPRGEDWLQRGTDSFVGSIELQSKPASQPGSPRSELMNDPSAFMRRLVGTTDPRKFLDLVGPLESAIPELALQQKIETLWRLASTLDILATEGPEVRGSRAAMSKALLRVLHDPITLSPVAARVLSPGDVAGERLLTSAGSFGAHALYLHAFGRLTPKRARAS